VPVVEVFVRLHAEGLSTAASVWSTGTRCWAPPVSDLEVTAKRKTGKIWEIRYPLEDGSGSVVVATTRPERCLGTSPLRQSKGQTLHRDRPGRRVQLPLSGARSRHCRWLCRSGIRDRVLKITPAHVFNDMPWPASQAAADRRDDARGEDERGRAGCLSRTGQFEARKTCPCGLHGAGAARLREAYKLRLAALGPHRRHRGANADRPGFVQMDGLARRGLEAVAKGEVKFSPEHWTSGTTSGSRRSRLVHLAPAMVGPSDTRLVRR